MCTAHRPNRTHETTPTSLGVLASRRASLALVVVLVTHLGGEHREALAGHPPTARERSEEVQHGGSSTLSHPGWQR